MKPPKKQQWKTKFFSRRTGFVGIVEVGVYLMLIGSVAGFAGKDSFLADLLSQFRVQYAIVAVIAVGLLAYLKRTLTALVALMVLALNLWLIAPYYLTGTQALGKPSCRVMVFNVKSSNPNHDEVLQYIERCRPDVLVLLEVTEAWSRALTRLDTVFPHRALQPRSDNFGISVYSKILLDSVQTEVYSRTNVPSLNIFFKVEQQRINLVGTHPIPPMRPNRFNSRKVHLSNAVSTLDRGVPRLLVGDFNLTPWSPCFADLIEEGRLRDAALGYGAHPTWNAFPTWLGGLKLDHILVSSEIEVIGHEIGPHLGSDHRPVIVDFCLKPKREPGL